MRFKIVETDNYGGDYPNEQFVNLPATTADQAALVAAVINNVFNHSGQGNRYWVVKPENYELQPGFEP